MVAGRREEATVLMSIYAKDNLTPKLRWDSKKFKVTSLPRDLANGDLAADTSDAMP
jgi:hypothetical protein